jgi:hypothetical protein
MHASLISDMFSLAILVNFAFIYLIKPVFIYFVDLLILIK